jgi:hypothetical protein
MYEAASPSIMSPHMYEMWRRVGLYEPLHEYKRA